MTAPSPLLVLCTANLLLIAALPRVFFKPGRLNAAWWLTAAPFALAAAAIVAAAVGWIDPQRSSTTAAAIATAFATVAGGMSIGIIGYTLGTHTRPVSLWHQEDDAPAALVTRGAYARVRHPFYAAFILALLACALAVPHPITFAALASGTLQLHRTARREERRLAAAFGMKYAEYMRRTGRFLPPLLGR